MKRYKYSNYVIPEGEPWNKLEEDPNGEWVRFDDAMAEIERRSTVSYFAGHKDGTEKLDLNAKDKQPGLRCPYCGSLLMFGGRNGEGYYTIKCCGVGCACVWIDYDASNQIMDKYGLIKGRKREEGFICFGDKKIGKINKMEINGQPEWLCRECKSVCDCSERANNPSYTWWICPAHGYKRR